MPAGVPSCGHTDTLVEFYRAGGHSFSWTQRRAIERVVSDASKEVRTLLPALPHGLVLKVEAGSDVIPETGEVANAFQPNVIWWDVDPRRPGGVRSTINRQLRGSLFHQFHHLVRGQAGRDRTFIDTIVSEGTATAFEGDFAQSSPPWGVYADDVRALVPEVLALPDETVVDEWLSRNPATRRWTGQRVGTYRVDAAGRAAKRNAAQMVSMSTDEVIRLALADPAP